MWTGKLASRKQPDNDVISSDFCHYDELDQPIVAVALAKPRPGVFVDQVKHILVISTPVEVTLLGVSLNKEKTDLTIYPTNLSIASDNVNMTDIVSSDSGRIFMCGKDGNIYEFLYQVS